MEDIEIEYPKDTNSKGNEELSEEEKREKEDEKALLITRILFVAGFFCQCAWPFTMIYRNRRSSKIQWWRTLSLVLFWVIVTIEFVIVWITIIVLAMTNSAVQAVALGKGNPDYFPVGEWFAIIYAILFVIVVGWDFIKIIVHKIQESKLIKKVSVNVGSKIHEVSSKVRNRKKDPVSDADVI